uniref:Transmembrane protein n=1 Tax=Sipha flava TaxID=143950 RepID=A0A2S2QZT2_9HEMI
MSYSQRFSIDDAFEEELMDDIKVYGSSLGNSPLQSPGQSKLTKYGGTGHESVTRTKKFEETQSRDSDSLIYNSTAYSNNKNWCWHHPQVRENWRVVLAAVFLLIIGTALLSLAIIVQLTPNTDYHPIVFFIAGFICFIPGAYHVIYIYLAARGYPENNESYGML